MCGHFHSRELVNVNSQTHLQPSRAAGCRARVGKRAEGPSVTASAEEACHWLGRGTGREVWGKGRRPLGLVYVCSL